MGVKIDESLDSFRALRENGAYYVDKTAFLKEYLQDYFKSVVLFTRPRRFGKTLTMTMFRDFLDMRQDSRDIFSGLEIMNHPDVVHEYMNRYPVVFLSLKEVSGQGFESVLKQLRAVLSTVCKKNAFLLESDAVDDADMELLGALRHRRANEEDMVEALGLLARMLHAHFGRRVFVIVDEYDVPMAKALGSPVYDQVRDMVEHMLSYVCKTNDDVRAVMLPGCLHTVKNSAYTGVNNIIPYTVLTPLYASVYGIHRRRRPETARGCRPFRALRVGRGVVRRIRLRTREDVLSVGRAALRQLSHGRHLR